MKTSSPDAASTHESGPREWRAIDLVLLLFAALVVFAVVFWAALGKPPLAGTAVVGVLGFLFAALAALSAGALAAGAVVEARHPDWSRLRGADHVFLTAALAVLLLAECGAGWWLFTSDSGGAARWIFLAVTLAAAAGGAWWARPALRLLPGRPVPGAQPRWALWPRHAQDAPGDEMWRLFTPLSGLLGGALGVVLAVAYLGISAWQENAAMPPPPPLPAALTGVSGGYVALGDSYSAGEGLPPFAPGTAATGCDRSVHSAYPVLLFRLLRRHDRRGWLRFTACSGALVSQLLSAAHRPGAVVPPQLSGTVRPSARLVTLTIGGNNAIFAKVVSACLASGSCLRERFPPPGVREATARPVPPGQLLTQWGPATIEQIGGEDAATFRTLRRDFPHARIIVIGYPYLFPATPAPGFPFYPPMCASILNRFSAAERAGFRRLQDDFNNRLYEEAAASGVEFVSPRATWAGHEPCGPDGQYTNSVKPYLNFPNPVNGGSFHPNAAGQDALARLLACYLDAYRKPPDPFRAAQPPGPAIPAGRLVTPARLQLAAAPGLTSVPGAGAIPGC